MSQSLILIVMPVYNDWQTAAGVCRALDSVLCADTRSRFEVLLVDDGSTERPLLDFSSQSLSAFKDVSILELTRNVGHQRAIAIALAYIHDGVDADAVLIMDADGEDRPEDVPRLLAAFRETEGERVVFAARRKRLEGTAFRAGYALYRAAHRALTGFGIRMGNFSVIPKRYLSSLVTSPELWSHYAATVVNIGLPIELVPADRGRRLGGRSHMNYVSLVAHGLAALSVFRERVGTRLLIGACGLGALLAALAIPLLVGMSRHGISAGRAVVAGTLVLLICQITTAAFIFAFGILANRRDLGSLPLHDYKPFVRKRWTPGGTSTARSS